MNGQPDALTVYCLRSRVRLSSLLERYGVTHGSYSLNEIGGLSMAKHEREATDKKRDAHPESDEARANPKVIETGEKLKDEIDDLVDEIDQVLEENAEEFVKNYVQKGGQ